mgnify:CR=1 FL=1
MNSANDELLSSRWDTLQQGQFLSTPSRRKSFEIASTTWGKITIMTEGATEIGINRQAFLAALNYLSVNKHSASNKVKIGSNKDITKASPLCVTIRNANGVNIMVSTYVIPMLAKMDLVGIDSRRPNRTWLL